MQNLSKVTPLMLITAVILWTALIVIHLNSYAWTQKPNVIPMEDLKNQAFQVYNTLEKHADYPIPPLKIINDPEVNAWTDGMAITVTTGILRQFNGNADELALVIGHEMGHNIANHMVIDDFIITSMDKEATADKLGAFIMMRSGYDICRGKEFFKQMLDLFGDKAYVTSHPSSAFRLWQLDMPFCKQ